MKSDFPLLPINRVDKSDADVAKEVIQHMTSGGQYGWLKGWGSQEVADNWTQLGLVFFDQSVPFVRPAFPQTTKLLDNIKGIKIAVLTKLTPGTLLTMHNHPELHREGLLQMHLTIDTASRGDYCYINVASELKKHCLGEAFVFNVANDHFALNASDSDRIILYLEFRP